MSKKLIISPHIDDEILGCGGILDKDTFVLECGVDKFHVVSRDTRILELKQAQKLLGFECNKHYGLFENLEDGHDVEIIETQDIPIKNSNWCNQYNHFKGVLLGYEIEQFGMIMKLTATSIKKPKTISDSIFEIPKKHKKVSLERFLKEMEIIFSLLFN